MVCDIARATLGDTEGVVDSSIVGTALINTAGAELSSEEEQGEGSFVACFDGSLVLEAVWLEYGSDENGSDERCGNGRNEGGTDVGAGFGTDDSATKIDEV